MRDASAWVGQRIKEHRLAAGLSQAELARAVGVHQAAVSVWEHGKRAPGLEEVVALADVLNLSPVQLLPPARSRRQTAALLRAFIDTGNEKEELQVQGALQCLGDLLEQLEPLPVAISVPADRPLRAAQQLLSHAQTHGLVGERTDIEKIARLCGVHVRAESFPGALSGVLAKQDDVALIAVGRDQNLGRRRFAIAHELGHHLLRHYDDFHLDLGPSTELGDAPTYDWRLEREANDFAANVLMPAGRVRELKAQGASPSFMAERLGVNPIAMRYRLRNLELDDD